MDTWEMGRNDAVQSITGVRNCFVDYPELAWALFGRNCPADYPTPMNGGEEWPPASGAMTVFSAVPDDPAHGSVEVTGLCARTVPAEGYYASGYEVLRADLWYHDPEAENPYAELLHWDRGRLLCMQRRELDVSVVIHFTPKGQTDPCPVGHSWNEGAVTQAPKLDQPGVRTYHCLRCGREKTEPEAFRFADVSDSSKYYYNPVYWAVDHRPRITAGTDDSHFSPNRTCTRAETMFFLWAALGKPQAEQRDMPFTDVKPGAYYYQAVLWALDRGITGGTDPDRFGSNDPCTRAQVLSFLWTAVERPQPGTDEMPFRDVPADRYYCKPVLWAVENGITGGTGPDTFSPNDSCTRAQIVTFLHHAEALLN